MLRLWSNLAGDGQNQRILLAILVNRLERGILGSIRLPSLIHLFDRTLAVELAQDGYYWSECSSSSLVR